MRFYEIDNGQKFKNAAAKTVKFAPKRFDELEKVMINA